MPRLEALPDGPEIIALKGILDYAVWRGVPYVRAWPRKPPMPRSPAVRAQITAMTDYIQRLKAIDPVFIAAARQSTSGTNWTWRDAIITSAWGHLMTGP